MKSKRLIDMATAVLIVLALVLWSSSLGIDKLQATYERVVCARVELVWRLSSFGMRQEA